MPPTVNNDPHTEAMRAGRVRQKRVTSLPEQASIKTKEGTSSSDSESGQRKTVRARKCHRKSKGGCSSCKLRRVKCDETKPRCQTCAKFGVACGYGAKIVELHGIGESSFSLESSPPSVNKVLLSTINDSLQRQQAPKQQHSTTFQMSMEELEFLHQFRGRTMPTFGTYSSRPVYQEAAPRLALAHPFLLHIALGTTMAHDRIMTPGKPQSSAEIFHWCQGVDQYKKMLSSKEATSSEKDAMWVAAMLVAYATMAQVDANSPEELWPLSPESDTDLGWIKLFRGTQDVWDFVNLARDDSYLKDLPKHTCGVSEMIMADNESLASLPPRLIEMCRLDSNNDRQDNPFYGPAVMLGNLFRLDVPHLAYMKFSVFLKRLRPDFGHLLQCKDPRALLLMAYYHTLVGQGPYPWWRKRAALEGTAICVYLERYHGSLPHMTRLLEYPKRYCGWNAAMICKTKRYRVSAA